VTNLRRLHLGLGEKYPIKGVRVEWGQVFDRNRVFGSDFKRPVSPRLERYACSDELLVQASVNSPENGPATAKTNWAAKASAIQNGRELFLVLDVFGGWFTLAPWHRRRGNWGVGRAGAGL
jgi:hypothetical protein